MKKFLSVAIVAFVLLSAISVGLVNAQNTPVQSTSGDSAVSAQDAPIRVGSKQFTEQIVLGQLIVIALTDAGYEVEDMTNLGSTNVNREALLNAEIDVYPEYNGTAITNYFNDFDWVEIPDGTAGNAYLSYALVSAYDAAINDLIWLRPFPANNTYALAVKTDFAEENGVFTAQDLADYANDGGDVMLSTGDEFAQRPDGLAAFEETYGFDLTDGQMTVIAGATPAQTSRALNEDEANVAMVYGTDGALLTYDFVVLSDELGAQPVYQAAPVFRGDIIRANPEIAGILNPIFGLLDNDTMQELNARVEVQGEDASAVATDFLQTNGFID